MLTFILSVIVVSFISLCFFKSKFWENRYLVLLISGGVALVATLTTNFAIRGHLQTKVEVISTRPLYTFYVVDTLKPFLKGYNYTKHCTCEYTKVPNDSIHKKKPVSVLLYTEKKDSKTIYVGTFHKKDKQDYDLLDDIYIASSGNDSTAYRCRIKKVYDMPKSNWLTGFSLPRISTIEVFYIPTCEYKTIPDSLIRKIPF